MKHITDEQLEQDITIISNMKEVGAPGFFYTRLRVRMENEITLNAGVLTLKPIIVICVLTLFLFINSLLLGKDSIILNSTMDNNMEAFAASYDQTISN
jgi:hypothetical protein